jgi:hypothetical protein
MAKKRPAEPQTFWVPMKWEMHGGAWVEATTADEAVAKAERGDFLNGVELHQAGAELVDWSVTGKAELRR